MKSWNDNFVDLEGVEVNKRIQIVVERLNNAARHLDEDPEALTSLAAIFSDISFLLEVINSCGKKFRRLEELGVDINM